MCYINKQNTHTHTPTYYKHIHICVCKLSSFSSSAELKTVAAPPSELRSALFKEQTARLQDPEGCGDDGLREKRRGEEMGRGRERS